MDLLTWLYFASGLLFGLAFIPQIVALCKDESGAASQSISTWLIFTNASLIGLMYSILVNGDWFFIGTSAITTLGNLCVLSLACYKRWNYQLVSFYHRRIASRA